jgi:membrane protease YdiL (CAAX protease family)
VLDRRTHVHPGTFFATTFVLSWAVWVPLLLVHLDVLPPVIPEGSLTPVALLGVLMPAAAASVLTRRAGGRAALRRLWGRLGTWRTGWWWVPTLLLQPTLLVATALVVGAAELGDEVRAAPGLGVGAILTSVVFLVVAATGEEVGWRGLALPELQRSGTAMRAGVVLGLATATWHLPYWWLQGVPEDQGWAYLGIDYVFVLALNLQLTWLVNHSQGSVLVAVAFHLGFNTVNVVLLPVTASIGAFALLTVAECVVALALLPWLAAPGPHGRGAARGSGIHATSG